MATVFVRCDCDGWTVSYRLDGEENVILKIQLQNRKTGLPQQVRMRLVAPLMENGICAHKIKKMKDVFIMNRLVRLCSPHVIPYDDLSFRTDKKQALYLNSSSSHARQKFVARWCLSL